MTEQRQKLLDRFDKWLDSNPRKQIISPQCVNIAEEYAEEQLRLHGVSKNKPLAPPPPPPPKDREIHISGKSRHKM